MKIPALSFLAALALAGGCAFGGSKAPPVRAAGPEERLVLESSTLTSLALLEAAVGSFVRAAGKPPRRLEDLAPDHIPHLPILELGLSAHPEGSQVHNYGPGVLEGGELREALLQDTGRWGYAVEGNRARVFVDCAHLSSRGRSWHKERGAL